MRAFILIILMFFPLKLTAPEYRCLYIQKPQPINHYDRLIRAVVMVELSCGKRLYNERENAVGPFQIRQERLDDYNRAKGTSYKLNDCYDFALSRKIFLYYARGKSFEKAAKNWNGSGPKTAIYWNKVKKYL